MAQARISHWSPGKGAKSSQEALIRPNSHLVPSKAFLVALAPFPRSWWLI